MKEEGTKEGSTLFMFRLKVTGKRDAVTFFLNVEFRSAIRIENEKHWGPRIPVEKGCENPNSAFSVCETT